MDATTIVLPSEPAPARRPPLPLLAAVVPVIAGVVLWLVTGSLFALCFAALGPLMLVASFLDGIRSRGREHRRARAEADGAWQRAEAELERLHLEEHAAAWRRDPDVAGCLVEPPLRGHTEVGAGTTVVMGRGTTRSVVRATGGDDDRARSFRERSQRLEDAPIVLPLGGGVCVRAPEPIAAAVVRALVAQLCLRFPPSQLALCGPALEQWGLSVFPHAGRRRAGFRLGVGDQTATAGEGERVDAVICVRAPGDEPPDGVTTVLDCSMPTRARARTPQGVIDLAAEAMSAEQTVALGAVLADKAGDETSVPDHLTLNDLPPSPSRGLAAIFGRAERGELSVDLVEDGPHAIVTGMTGTGKSELLTSWVTAIAAVHPPEEVAFVLIDFKGGTAFDPLRMLPHVVAVVTDLDADGARRGVGSLTAELRRRESALAAAGVRDIGDCRDLARLVIVVDEFAALLQEHPDLGAVFTDVAARGRALGMHLVLGTQRASGIVRDALAANCPLRLSLRVAEAADSRFVIGSDAASELPGDAASRGLAFVRRPRDGDPRLARIALTEAADLRAAADRWLGHAGQESPWLPPLPGRLELPSTPQPQARAVLGLADEPDRQRQPWVTVELGAGLAVVGGPGSGKSSVVRMLAAQLPDAVVVPADPERAWDLVEAMAAGDPPPGLVLCDDLDSLVACYPPEHAQLFLSRWERLVRRPDGAVITLSRVTGPVGRLIDALPQRALLRMTSKVEHIAAGGDPAAFDSARPAGRAWMAGRLVQFCIPPACDADSHVAPGGGTEPPRWHAVHRRSGIVTAAVQATRTVIAATHPDHRVHTLAELDRGEHPDPADGADVIIIGDPEQWRARWAVLQEVRMGGELVVAAEHAPELRQLAGVREAAPYAIGHADRAWAVAPGQMPRRVLLA